MQLSDDAKKAMIVFGGGLLLFLLFKPKQPNYKKIAAGGSVDEPKPKERTKIAEPKADPKELKGNKKASDALIALKAYIAAYNSGEPQSQLNKLNAEIKQEYGLTVFRRGLDNKIVVADLTGKVIIENNG